VRDSWAITRATLWRCSALWSDLLLSAESDAERALTPIAETLLRELIAFASLHGGGPLAALERYLPRVRFVQWYLDALESIAGLRFADRRLPFVANMDVWDEAQPVAGYAGPDAPRPSHVVTSLVSILRLGSDHGPTWGRLLKAGSYAVREHGLDDGIRLLIDLSCVGFAPNPDDLKRVFAVLLAGRARAGSDLNLVNLVLGDPLPATNKGWLQAELSLDWLPEDNAEFFRPPIEPFLEAAVGAVAAARRAGSWDAWILAQCGLRRSVGPVTTLASMPGAQLRLGASTVLSQLQEIVADTYAFLALLLSKAAAGDLRAAPVLRAQAELQAVAAKQAGVPEPRIGKQRVLVPSGVADDLQSSSTAGLPAAWRRPSWRLVHAVVASASGAPSVTLMPLEPLGVPPRRAAKRQQQALAEVRRFSDSENYVAAIEGSTRILDEFPWSGNAYLERAIARDRSGDPHSALRDMIAAISLAPGHVLLWHSLSGVLKRLGAHGESKLAYGLGTYLAQYGRQLGISVV
jgi:hypothetical protein